MHHAAELLIKALATAVSCGVIAVLSKGCMVDEFRELVTCDVLQNHFNDFQAMAVKGK